jgi:hypothetical protein
MTDEPDNSVVPYRSERLPEKANPALPDAVWEKLQNLGVHAVNHLERILTDPRFAHFSIKEQMKVIETTMNRAYGSVDGSVRRHLHVHTDPESEVGFNAMRDLSRVAGKKLPEFRSPSVQDAEVVQPRRPLKDVS